MSLLAGVFFFFDPSHALQPGTHAYWEALAQGHWGRRAFLASFALSGLLALTALSPVVQLAGTCQHDKSALLHAAQVTAALGYALTATSYFRLLGGEARRALSYVQGDAAVREAISSFSLVLDPQGWLTFAGIAVFMAVVNMAALQNRSWSRVTSAVGFGVAAAYASAFVGLILQVPLLVSASAAVGAIVLGPAWWSMVAWRLLQGGAQHAAGQALLPNSGEKSAPLH
jgi:hypothetical protein